MGILKGIYQYEEGSGSEFKDWATEVPRECFGSILRECTKSYNSKDIKEMKSFIKKDCPGWSKWALNQIWKLNHTIEADAKGRAVYLAARALENGPRSVIYRIKLDMQTPDILSFLIRWIWRRWLAGMLAFGSQELWISEQSNIGMTKKDTVLSLQIMVERTYSYISKPSKTITSPWNWSNCFVWYNVGWESWFTCFECAVHGKWIFFTKHKKTYNFICLCILLCDWCLRWSLSGKTPKYFYPCIFGCEHYHVSWALINQRQNKVGGVRKKARYTYFQSLAGGQVLFLLNKNSLIPSSIS